jgi:hypothetical protein
MEERAEWRTQPTSYSKDYVRKIEQRRAQSQRRAISELQSELARREESRRLRGTLIEYILYECLLQWADTEAAAEVTKDGEMYWIDDCMAGAATTSSVAAVRFSCAEVRPHRTVAPHVSPPQPAATDDAMPPRPHRQGPYSR